MARPPTPTVTERELVAPGFLERAIEYDERVGQLVDVARLARQGGGQPGAGGGNGRAQRIGERLGGERRGKLVSQRVQGRLAQTLGHRFVGQHRRHALKQRYVDQQPGSACRVMHAAVEKDLPRTPPHLVAHLSRRRE
jgi:hypothetical protein